MDRKAYRFEYGWYGSEDMDGEGVEEIQNKGKKLL